MKKTKPTKKRTNKELLESVKARLEASVAKIEFNPLMSLGEDELTYLTKEGRETYEFLKADVQNLDEEIEHLSQLIKRTR
jgi:hypothetical protein